MARYLQTILGKILKEGLSEEGEFDQKLMELSITSYGQMSQRLLKKKFLGKNEFRLFKKQQGVQCGYSKKRKK